MLMKMSVFFQGMCVCTEYVCMHVRAELCQECVETGLRFRYLPLDRSYLGLQIYTGALLAKAAALR